MLNKINKIAGKHEKNRTLLQIFFSVDTKKSWDRIWDGMGWDGKVDTKKEKNCNLEMRTTEQEI